MYRDPQHKWGYLVSLAEFCGDQDAAVTDWVDEERQRHLTHAFVKLPHKDGPSANCGNPMSKDYIRFLESGRLRSGPRHFSVKKALDNNVACSYWTSARDRIMGQFVVWEELVG